MYPENAYRLTLEQLLNVFFVPRRSKTVNRRPEKSVSTLVTIRSRRAGRPDEKKGKRDGFLRSRIFERVRKLGTTNDQKLNTINDQNLTNTAEKIKIYLKIYPWARISLSMALRAGPADGTACRKGRAMHCVLLPLSPSVVVRPEWPSSREKCEREIFKRKIRSLRPASRVYLFVHVDINNFDCVVAQHSCHVCVPRLLMVPHRTVHCDTYT
jgi:hypothetical protein